MILASAAMMSYAPAALATQAHTFDRSFGGAGSGAGQLSLVAGSAETGGSGVAVNTETHDIYVADTANNRIAEFKSDDTFVRAWG